MTAIAQDIAPPQSRFLSMLVKSGLLVGMSDFLFASATGVLIKPYATPFRVFRGVASVLFGRQALNGGTSVALIGILMHFFTAFFWSLVFILILRASRAVREAIQTTSGAVVVAITYGPAIWLFMSLVFIPLMVHRPPVIGLKWWVQLIGHSIFVAAPMILVAKRNLK